MKKFLFSLLIFLLAHSYASAENTKLQISTGCGAIGDQIDVTLEITESSIVAGSFNIAYDSELLRPISYSRGEALGKRTMNCNLNYISENQESFVKANWLGDMKPITNGKLCTVTFEVISKEKAIAEIYIDYNKFLDVEGNIINCDICNGEIYINKLFVNTSYWQNGSEISGGLTAGILETDLEIFNGTSENKNVNMFIAKYSDSEALIGLDQFYFSLKPGESIADMKAVIIEEQVSFVKTFYWDADNLCIPYLEASELK